MLTLWLVSLATGCQVEIASPSSSGGVDTSSETSALRSLPYAEWVPLAPAEKHEGVTRWIPEKTAPGVTLFTPRHEARALLVDLAGKTRHVWANELPGGGPWQHVELLPGGDLLLVVKDRLLARIDWDSKPVWSIRGGFHHDVVRNARGTLWALDRHERSVEHQGARIPTLTDRVLEIDPDSGEILRTVPLLPALRGWIEDRLPGIARWLAEQGGREAIPELTAGTPPELFHTNSVVELDRDIAGLGRAGDLLLSVRYLDRLVVVDPATEEVRWIWGEEAGLDAQHNATILADGKVLLFDNGRDRGWSRVLEVDPVSRQVVWTYQTEPREDFYSASRGSAQRLLNGNTLITETDFGRIFEVTVDGEIVWEYLGPILKPEGPDGEPVRAAIYRAARIEGELLDSLREPLRRARREEPGVGAEERPLVR
jgi:hypothetical protein